MKYTTKRTAHLGSVQRQHEAEGTSLVQSRILLD